MIKICISCDQSIKDDEAYREVDKLSPSAAGSTLYVHSEPCTPVPVQTNQASLHH